MAYGTPRAWASPASASKPRAAWNAIDPVLRGEVTHWTSRQPTIATASNNRWYSARASPAPRQGGVGRALLPCYLVEPAGLVRMLSRAADIRRELWLAVHADLQRAPRIRIVIEFLAALARTRGASLQGRAG